MSATNSNNFDRSNVVHADFTTLRGRAEPGATIIAVGGGKGGVGKSFVSSSLAINLAQLGYETLAVDLDLGGANLHTNLGLPLRGGGINDFIQDPGLNFAELAQSTHWPKLKLISGASDIFDVANVDEGQRSRIMSSIFRYRADFVVLDLSAGTHQATLDFFLMAKHKVCVFTPEPSSIENAYRFMKAAFFRKLRRYEQQFQLEGPIRELTHNRSTLGIHNPGDLLRALVAREPVLGPKLVSLMSELNFGVVLNQARTRQEMELGQSLQSVCRKDFGFPGDFLGGLEYDNAVWQSLRQRNHLLKANAQSHLYGQLMSISRKIAGTQGLKAVI